MSNFGKNKFFPDNLLLKVRVLLLILLTCAGQMFASSARSQTTVDLKMRNASLKQVIERIQEQTDYHFVYSLDNVDLTANVNVNLTSDDINFVLRKVLDESEIKYRILDKHIVLSTSELQDPDKKIKISGLVVDENDVPLPGVSVMIKGTTIGITTGGDGRYSLEVPADSKVVKFSFIGMNPVEIKIEGKTVINAKLENDSFDIEEVVAVGYGTQRKVDLTGSVADVKGDVLKRSAAPNLASSLAGKLSGVVTTQSSGVPGNDGVRMSVRGIGTFNNQSVLVIVDGTERSMSRIDPDDIESVTVLKDAASTAVYGSRAANGVILVTTKRGLLQKPEFNYTSTFSIQELTQNPDMMNAYEYAKNISIGQDNYGKQRSFTDDEIEQFRTGERPSYDWIDHLMNSSAPMNKQHLSIRGGNESVKYYVAGSYLDQSGLIDAFNFNKYSLRSNLTLTLAKNLEVDFNMEYRLQRTASSYLSINKIYETSLYCYPYLNPAPSFEEVGVENAYGHGGMRGNPKGDANDSGYSKTHYYGFYSTIKAVYKVPQIKGLSLNATMSYNNGMTRKKRLYKAYDVWILNENTNEYSLAQHGPQKTELNQDKDNSFKTLLRFGFNYDKKIDDHHFNLVGVYEWEQNRSDKMSAGKIGFLSPSLDYLKHGDVDGTKASGSAGLGRRIGYVGRLGYDYKSRYLFQFNMRIDQSHIFAEDNRTGVFPAVSAGWRISEEPFMANQSLFSNLKLRGSIGLIGNDRVDAFQYLSDYSLGSGLVIDGEIRKGVYPGGIPNPLITWEKSLNQNIALDLGFFDNKLTFTGEWFYRHTYDMLVKNTGVIPASLGAESLPKENIGEMDSWGLEFSTMYNNNIGDLRYQVGVNFLWTDNEVKKYPDPENALPDLMQTGNRYKFRTGYLSGGIIQSDDEIANLPKQFDDTYHGKLQAGDLYYLDINGRDADGNLTGLPDGVVNGDDRTVIGNSNRPRFVYGLNLGLEYKGVNLSASFSGAAGYDHYINPTPFPLNGNSPTYIADAWSPDNTDAKFPRMSTEGQPPARDVTSDYWIENMWYLRLKTLEVGYDFPWLKPTLKRMKLGGVRLFVSGTNLFTLSNTDTRDPEVEKSSPTYPQVRTYSVGLNVKF